jgi:hypothetical protein
MREETKNEIRRGTSKDIRLETIKKAGEEQEIGKVLNKYKNKNNKKRKNIEQKVNKKKGTGKYPSFQRIDASPIGLQSLVGPLQEPLH